MAKLNSHSTITKTHKKHGGRRKASISIIDALSIKLSPEVEPVLTDRTSMDVFFLSLEFHKC